MTRAGFSLSVNGFDKPMELLITPPNTLRLCRHTASRLAHEWMERRQFQVRAARASGGHHEAHE